MNTNYTFSTPDHGYDIFPDLLSPDNVQVRAEFKDSLEELVATLELAGVADDRDFTELQIEEGSNDYDTFFFIDITKSDLALYLQFEILNYLGVSPA
jgi:hypothetical protein